MNDRSTGIVEWNNSAPERELNEGKGRHVNDVPVVHEVVRQIAPTKYLRAAAAIGNSRQVHTQNGAYAERVSSAVLNPKPAIVTDLQITGWTHTHVRAHAHAHTHTHPGVIHTHTTHTTHHTPHTTHHLHLHLHLHHRTRTRTRTHTRRYTLIRSAATYCTAVLGILKGLVEEIRSPLTPATSSVRIYGSRHSNGCPCNNSQPAHKAAAAIRERGRSRCIRKIKMTAAQNVPSRSLSQVSVHYNDLALWQAIMPLHADDHALP